ncbi:MAG TPA: ribonuclease HII [Candidatus Sulfotelmatobacter sp.]|nr:ribonuclease HII [Candidatus Sulfotelmatobacter sp.]
MLPLTYEKALARRGCKLVAGVDEAGRGPLAGPIVAAAVILPPDVKLKGLNDSKKLSAAQRERLFREISAKAVNIGLAIVSHRQIDRLNIEKANQLVLKLAVDDLALLPDHILVDGRRKIGGLRQPQRALIGGDGRCASIAAASIIAKVTRDRLMVEYQAVYPLYRFAKHKGYGTKEHFKLLAEHGPCPIHRRSFRLTGGRPDC